MAGRQSCTTGTQHAHPGIILSVRLSRQHAYTEADEPLCSADRHEGSGANTAALREASRSHLHGGGFGTARGQGLVQWADRDRGSAHAERLQDRCHRSLCLGASSVAGVFGERLECVFVVNACKRWASCAARCPLSALPYVCAWYIAYEDLAARYFCMLGS